MSKQTNKRQVEKAKETRENMRAELKKRKKSQIRWSPWQILRPSGTAAALRVAFVVWVKKTKIKSDVMGLGLCLLKVLCMRQDLTSSFKTCM